MAEGQIYKIHSDFYYVDDGVNSYECKIREVLKKQKEKILVGDFVEFENGVITNIIERKNFIRRPSVANIDQIIIVSALKQPDLDLHQLNRYIALAKYYNTRRNKLMKRRMPIGAQLGFLIGIALLLMVTILGMVLYELKETSIAYQTMLSGPVPRTLALQKAQDDFHQGLSEMRGYIAYNDGKYATATVTSLHKSHEATKAFTTHSKSDLQFVDWQTDLVHE